MATQNSFTDVLSPSEPNPELIARALNRLKLYQDKASEYNKLNIDFKNKTGVDINDATDARSIVTQRMVAEAKDRTAKGKKGAIPVIGNPLNKNTCAAGVCTIAANAGVDFSKVGGNLQSGVATDEKGRKIIQYNPVFTNQLDKTGYYELKPGEKPQPGDLVQYFETQGSVGALHPYHLEFITEDAGDGTYKTFNNYGLFNEGKGESSVADVRGTNQSERGRNSTMNRFYRLTPEAAAKAAGEDVAGSLSTKGKLVKELADLRKNAIGGESEDVFGLLYLAQRGKISKEEALDSALALSKDKELVRAVYDQIFK